MHRNVPEKYKGNETRRKESDGMEWSDAGGGGGGGKVPLAT